MRWLGLIVFTACASDHVDVACMNAAAVSFQTDVAPLLSHCGGELCHGGIGPGWGYTRLVDVPSTQCGDHRMLVTPGDPTTSYLVQKLEGVDMCSGVQMPRFGTAMSHADVQKIADWICQGAPNN